MPSSGGVVKKAGILLHISSLDSGFGIGDFGPVAYRFADFLVKGNQSYWQILPLGYIGLGNSPYQCYSSKAINPYFIDPLEFIDMGLCGESYINGFREIGSRTKVEYDEVFKKKDEIFKRAFEEFDAASDEYTLFKAENAGWIDDYALFTVLLKKTEGLTLREFSTGLIERNPTELELAYNKYRYEVEREIFLQYVAFRQWFRLKDYVNGLGIKIIGDIPIYLSFDSVEVWVERELFKIGESLHLEYVSGVPPDALSDDGQIWGNPVYDWKHQKRNGYEWWIDRIGFALKKFDIIRIDHFRGFAKYYAIRKPFDDAHKGRWKKGPGYGMFKLVNSIFDESAIIAEDLGLITRDVRKLIEKTGYAGMKVAQFGYGDDPGNEHLPENYKHKSYVYTGTHDNNTLLGWYDELDEKELGYLKKHLPGINRNNVCEMIICRLMESDAMAVIIPLQDYMELPGTARMNIPSTPAGNWEWRMTGIPDGLDEKIRGYTEKRRRKNGQG